MPVTTNQNYKKARANHAREMLKPFHEALAVLIQFDGEHPKNGDGTLLTDVADVFVKGNRVFTSPFTPLKGVSGEEVPTHCLMYSLDQETIYAQPLDFGARVKEYHSPVVQFEV